MCKVLVMLSSYNGGKYLKAQLDSILKQKGVELYCVIRDDGSLDTTKDILEKYELEYYDISVKYGDNIGWKESFMEIIYSSGEYDYYAFSDQDDIWLDNKLSVAIEKIKEYSVPTMYYSNSTLVDNNLNIIKNRVGIAPPNNNFMVLAQNFAQGCTMVLNRQARDLILKYKPKYTFSHDIWFPILCFYFGKIVYDIDSYILYRQHGNNVAGGTKPPIWNQIKNRIKSIRQNESYYYYAKELLNGYKDIIPDLERDMLCMIVNSNTNLIAKYKLLINRKMKKYTFKGTVLLKLMIMVYRFR